MINDIKSNAGLLLFVGLAILVYVKLFDGSRTKK